MKAPHLSLPPPPRRVLSILTPREHAGLGHITRALRGTKFSVRHFQRGEGEWRDPAAREAGEGGVEYDEEEGERAAAGGEEKDEDDWDDEEERARAASTRGRRAPHS